METKCIKTFTKEQTEEFAAYLDNILIEDGSITCIESYDENKTEVWGEDENDFDVNVFLSDQFTLEGILKWALERYGSNLDIELKYADEPIDYDPDEEPLWYKYLRISIDANMPDFVDCDYSKIEVK